METLKSKAMIENTVEELPILDFDAVEFYVGNAKQASRYYQQLFGFDIVAYRGPETGFSDTCSYVLVQNQVRFMLTAALRPDHPVGAHVQRHGDGIKDIAFRVPDAQACYQAAVERGARPVQAPYVLEDDRCKVVKATIAVYGETTHTFVERQTNTDVFEPGYIPCHLPGRHAGLVRTDHLVTNVAQGQMDTWVDFYERVFGFHVLRHFDKKDISSQYSALNSKVMANRNGTVKLPINEPAEGLRKSQIQEYLDFYGTPGIQHLALATEDILATVKTLRTQGVDFMTVPAAYYETLFQRIGTIAEPLNELASMGILVDRDEGGYLLQIFTQPVQDRPTVFYEIIQRAGAEGFGKGNFKALFEAIEEEQAKRGNL